MNSTLGSPRQLPLGAKIGHDAAIFVPELFKACVITMLQRPEGATIAELVAATAWQSHTVRCSISGALKKKLGLPITAAKVEGRGLFYRLAAG